MNHAYGNFFTNTALRRNVTRSTRHGSTAAGRGSADLADHVLPISVADLHQDASKFGLGLIGQFNQRQTNFGRHEAEQAQRVFEWSRASLPEQYSSQFRNQTSPQRRRNVGCDRNTAVASLRKEGQSGRVVARKEPEIRTDERPQPRRPSNIAGSILETDPGR